MLSVSLILLTTFVTLFALSAQDTKDTFMYFAYGSNLLKKRIHVENKSARFYGIALLKDYRLDFNMQHEAWNGAVATICEDPGAHVWGALWVMALTDLPNIDKQEGVDIHLYYPKNVTVSTPTGTPVEARTYIEVHNPDKLPPGAELPYERRPSISYLKVIYYGATDLKLPSNYIEFIKSFPTNGKLAPWKTRKELGPLFYDKTCILNTDIKF